MWGRQGGRSTPCRPMKAHARKRSLIISRLQASVSAAPAGLTCTWAGEPQRQAGRRVLGCGDAACVCNMQGHRHSWTGHGHCSHAATSGGLDCHASQASGLGAGPVCRPSARSARRHWRPAHCSRAALQLAVCILTSHFAAPMALAAVQSATCFQGRPVGRRLLAAGRFARVSAPSASRVSY